MLRYRQHCQMRLFRGFVSENVDSDFVVNLILTAWNLWCSVQKCRPRGILDFLNKVICYLWPCKMCSRDLTILNVFCTVLISGCIVPAWKGPIKMHTLSLGWKPLPKLRALAVSIRGVMWHWGRTTSDKRGCPASLLVFRWVMHGL